MLPVVFGIICGIAMGLTGGGGSILAVPLLTYGMKLSFHQAVAISLLIVALTAIWGLVLKAKKSQVEISAGLVFAATGIFLAPVGSYIGSFIDGKILSTIFSVLMFAVGILTWLKSRQKQVRSSEHYTEDGKLKLSKKSILTLLASGVVTGFLTGMFGVGGGFLIVPTLLMTLRMPIKKAIGTSLLVMVLVASSGFISHMKHTVIHWLIAAWFIVGSVIGMFVAVKVKERLDGSMLQKIFAVLLVILGLATFVAHVT